MAQVLDFILRIPLLSTFCLTEERMVRQPLTVLIQKQCYKYLVGGVA